MSLYCGGQNWLCRMFRRIPALYPLDASSTQLHPHPHPTQLWQREVSPDTARWLLGATVGPGCQPLPWTRSCSVASVCLVLLVPMHTPHLRFFRTKLFLASMPVHMVVSVPEVLFPPLHASCCCFGFCFFFFFFFALDVSFQRSSHNLSLSISETCFFHRIEHNLIIFVYLEVFFPYVTVNPWRTESVF